MQHIRTYNENLTLCSMAMVVDVASLTSGDEGMQGKGSRKSKAGPD